MLDARTRILGADHPVTLTARYNLAGVLAERGSLEQAEAEYRAVLDARTRALGADHPVTLAARHNLAVLAERESWSRLRLSTGPCWTPRPGPWAPDDRSTLTTRHNLADMLAERGELEQAEAVVPGRAGRPDPGGRR